MGEESLMKRIIAVFGLFAAIAYGQAAVVSKDGMGTVNLISGLVTSGSNLVANYDSKQVVLLEYTTQEPCPECGFRYAIGCAPMTPDCGVPSKTVHHWEEFKAIGDAVAFANTQPSKDFSLVKVYPRTIIRIMVAQEVQIEKVVQKIETPQPPVVGEVITYKAK
jgi:hypothetical protein